MVDIVAHNADGGWMQWENHLRRFRDNPGPAFGGTLTRLTIDPAAGKVTHEQLNDRGCEFRNSIRDASRVNIASATWRRHRGRVATRTPSPPSTIAPETRADTPSPTGNTICGPLFAPRTTPGNEGDGWLLTLEHEPCTAAHA